MDYTEYKNYLAHHGIQGQKWGIRRYQNEDGTRTSLGKKKEQRRDNRDAKKDYNTNLKLEKKNKYTNISEMNDQELRERINRLQMERQYSYLLRTQKYAVRKGKEKTDNIAKKFLNRTVDKTLDAGAKGVLDFGTGVVAGVLETTTKYKMGG